MEHTAHGPVDHALQFLTAEALDRLARRALEDARPLRVDVVASDDELRQVQRLRHEAVVQRGWADAESDADGVERDEFDRSAVHVAAWYDDDPVGTVRVVLPAAERPLPTEREFGLLVEPRGRVVDWGRLVVAPLPRPQRRTVMLAVLGRAWLATRAIDAVACIGVATPAVLALYRSLGVHATVLAGPRLYWGEQRYAARLLGVVPDGGLVVQPTVLPSTTLRAGATS